ncbi:MAG: DUF5714 domain-containing protein [Bacteroidia bacterium]|nr:DUF5714 domain-containing protein [Bacteroidia bacterium]
MHQVFRSDDDLCQFCGAERVPGIEDIDVLCSICESPLTGASVCTAGHAICPDCKALSAVEVIERYCRTTRERDPQAIVEILMGHSAVRLQGADHHFLVPAALIAAYANSTEDATDRALRLHEARILAECAHEGQCGSSGRCGAATGSGIFFQVFARTSEFADFEKQWSTRAVSRTLERIGDDARHRCCKMDTSLAVLEAAQFLFETTGVRIGVQTHRACGLSKLNQECLATSCPFYNNPLRELGLDGVA